MSETITITPTAISTDAEADARPVKIQYGHIKMQLPRLNDSAQLPIELLTAGLSVVARGWDNLTHAQGAGQRT